MQAFGAGNYRSIKASVAKRPPHAQCHLCRNRVGKRLLELIVPPLPHCLVFKRCSAATLPH